MDAQENELIPSPAEPSASPVVEQPTDVMQVAELRRKLEAAETERDEASREHQQAAEAFDDERKSLVVRRGKFAELALSFAERVEQLQKELAAEKKRGDEATRECEHLQETIAKAQEEAREISSWLIRELDEIKKFSVAHHEQQEAHILAHGLAVDIPARIDAILDRMFAIPESSRVALLEGEVKRHSDRANEAQRQVVREIEQRDLFYGQAINASKMLEQCQSRVTTLEAENGRLREASEALLKHCSTEIEGGSMRDLSDKAVRLDWLSRLLVLRNSLRAALAPSSSSPTKPVASNDVTVPYWMWRKIVEGLAEADCLNDAAGGMTCRQRSMCVTEYCATCLAGYTVEKIQASSPTVAEVQGAPAQVSEAKERVARNTCPRIVCLCGSTRFYREFQRANYNETMAGRIVLSVGVVPDKPASITEALSQFSPIHRAMQAPQQHGEDVGCTPEQKIALDELHKRKIDLADEILVLNVGGYIGSSTTSEIKYGVSKGKPVRWLEPPSDALLALTSFDSKGKA